MPAVGFILALLALTLCYQIARRLPAHLATGIALIVFTACHIASVRTANELLSMATSDAAASDPWAVPPAAKRRLARRSLALSLRQTEIHSLYPQVAEAGYRLAGRLGYA